MFFADVMKYLQAQNLSPQGKDKIACDLGQTIFSIQNKITLFQREISTISLQHFPLLKGFVNCENDLRSLKIKVYVEIL